MLRTTIFPAQDHVRTPWRNRLGTTVELAKEDGPDGFDWRLSIADISADGPFSQFPGYRRIISVVEGSGMSLTVNGRTGDAIGPFAPFTFDGADRTECELPDGPIRDFNLIYRDDRVSARLRWIRGGDEIRHSDEIRPGAPASTRMIFNAGPDLSVSPCGDGEPATPLTLGHFDLLRLDGPDAPAVTVSGPEDAVWCVVEIRV